MIIILYTIINNANLQLMRTRANQILNIVLITQELWFTTKKNRFELRIRLNSSACL